MDHKQLVDALRSAGRGGDPDPARIQVSYTLFPRGNVATGGEWVQESLARHAERRIAAGQRCLPQGRKLLAPTFVGAKLAGGRRADAAAEAIYWLFFDADNVGEWDTLLSALNEAGIAHVASRSCSDGTPRGDGGDSSAVNCKWHLYLPLAAPLLVDGADFKSRRYSPELRHLYRALVKLGGLSGCDESVDDLAQCAYIGMRPDRYAPAREVRHSGGALLDWDAALHATAYVPPVAPPRSVPGGGTGPRAASSNGPRAAGPRKGKQGAPGAAPAGGWDGGATAGESAGTLAYLAAKGLGLLGPQHGPHSYLLLCPWRADHSPGCPQRDQGQYDTSTVIYVGGSVSGGFSCKHAHCADRKIGDLLRFARLHGVPLPDRPEWGGASADDGDFETENAEPPQAATGEGSKGDDVTNKKVHQNTAKSKSCPHLPAEVEAQLLRAAPTKAQMEAGVSGSIKPASANVLLVLANDDRWAGVLSWDEFSLRMTKTIVPPWHPSQVGADSGPGEWTRADDRRLVAWLEMEYGISVSCDAAGSCALLGAKRAPCHPVKDYLLGLKWDGVPRLGTWLSAYLGAEQSRYAELCGTYWALSAVARIFAPGCQVDSMVVLEGPQGRGKSQSLRVLGGEWYCGTEIDWRSKDKYSQIQGVWIYEVAELAGLDKHDDGIVKAFISAQIDRYRAPYDSIARAWPRTVCFAGSVNPDHDRGGTYLKDPTGARRYWPVRCFVTRERADLEALKMHRDQIWAEAVQRVLAGEQWHKLTVEEQALFQAEQAARSVDQQTDPWDQPIAQWIGETLGGARVYRSGGDDGQDQYVTLPLTPETLLSEVVGMARDRQSQQARLRCGKALRRLGWRRADKTRRVGGVACFPYVPDLDEAGAEALRELAELLKCLPEARRERYLAALYSAPITPDRIAAGRALVEAAIAAQP